MQGVVETVKKNGSKRVFLFREKNIALIGQDNESKMIFLSVP